MMGCIDKKISELSQLITPAVNDLVPIVDVSVADFETKYITYADFFTTPVISDYIDLQEIIPPAAPPADTLRLYVEDIHGFSFFSFIDDTGMVRRLVRDSVFLARNMTGGPIPAFRVVYATGSSMGVPTIDLARSDVMATMPAIGVTTEAIADGGYGRVMQMGLIENVNTAAYPVGSVLYVSDVIAGRVVIAPPITPHLTQEIGMVLVSDAAAGAVQIVARSLTGDEYGTAQNIFYIGDGLAGNKTLTFNGVADGSIIWDGVDLTITPVDNVVFEGDIFTDRWLYQDSNTFLGVDVIGAGNLAHGAGTQGWENLAIGYQSGYEITTGYGNSYLGYQAGYHNTVGADNIIFGYQAGYGAVGAAYNNDVIIGHQAGYSLTIGHSNIFIGYASGYINSTGYSNVFVGYNCGYSNIGGYDNVFVGKNAGYSNQNGLSNIYIGAGAGYQSTGGDYNIFVGTHPGYSNTTGDYNLAIGTESLYFNQTGQYNIAIGYATGRGVITNSHDYNIFIGFNTGYSITIGQSNTLIGTNSGYTLNSGDNNIFIGNNSGYYQTNVNNNVAIGYFSSHFNQTGQYNVVIGTQAGRGVLNQSFGTSVFIGYQSGYSITTGTNNVFIGYQSGYTNNIGQQNVFVGRDTGRANSSGQRNTFLGYRAGYAVNIGNYNICLGFQAGDVLTTGDYNIIIGYNIDPTANNVNSQLNIGDLIYGDLANAKAGVNVTPPNLAASFHVDQPAADGAEPVLLLDQADIDYVLMKIIGTAEAASADRTLVAASDYGTPGALVGWMQIEVEDIGNRVVDADYFIPFYAIPT